MSPSYKLPTTNPSAKSLKTRAQESRSICTIPVFTSPNARTANVNNLIPIPTRKPTEHSATGTHFVPSLMLSNPMSLVPKLSEVQELLLREKVEIGCIVESWLKHHISDSVLNIEGYNLVRKDCLSRDHGGVCIYIKEDIKYQLVENLTCCDDHEIIWVKLKPTRSPRGVSCVLLAVVYYPGRTSPVDSDGQKLLNHLFDSTSMTAAEAMFPSCGLIITGDFNRLNTGRLQNHFKLKQLVKFPTRGDAVLDLVLTNMSDHFSSIATPSRLVTAA